MELFERIRYLSTHEGISLAKIAEHLNVSPTRFHQWLNAKSQKNIWEHLNKIYELFPGVSKYWLFWDEGEPFRVPTLVVAESSSAPVAALHAREDATPYRVPAAQRPPVSLIGFAACSTLGWHGTMTIPVPVEPPVWHDDMVAVMAMGESMLPAGIGHGHICYCDTTKTPGINEAAYVETEDHLGTIKLFCGRTDRGGEDFVNLQGWLEKEPGVDTQKILHVDIAARFVRRLAPVIYVRRRL